LLAGFKNIKNKTQPKNGLNLAFLHVKVVASRLFVKLGLVEKEYRDWLPTIFQMFQKV
jgi:hypothetical protein